mmetsp:Transcript_27390/g.49388  ORF Transcript_27390/g.49388 Transcript_27390/m.49388 type:complete len:423 (-) Transcript_27390:113-1381(-)|eukprot:CAMPEP_0201914522 /NCGR_PEP_ID=MMETSP0903-20130614/4685_1 /ASSEMBLY_ACC=CAM_ASM_000552 /TAXON_ID=420261 /ORGANISM="Thalassiosira antarctica, Strain CCMP982" /LENGTH=422 /DNA_ID=CAMNT_0048449923 /DNA_START=42 /DNA_END=1310 /DNA_ORIENTATION=-
MTSQWRKVTSVGLVITAKILCADAFAPIANHNLSQSQQPQKNRLYAKKKSSSSGGFGGGGFGSSSTAPSKKKAARGKSGRADLLSTLNDDDSKKKKDKSSSQTFVKSDQEQLLNDLAAKSAQTIIGKAVASSPDYNSPDMDPFWQLLPSLISTKFPSASDGELKRVAGMVEFSLGARGLLEDDVISDQWRPHEELHAYMPGLGATEPFLDPNQLGLCKQLSENYEVITKEYEALLEERFDSKGKDRFQSVTSMNYDAGWKTMVLFYNGHRIKDFPYHLCPVTTRIMESVPLAGRIAGFNRQQPESGIPLHSDGNNMWLTCQMGMNVPPPITNEAGDKVPSAHIRVGPDTRHWEEGQCLLYDTTYEHETFNAHPAEERVVLHVDFFNTLKMTKLEIKVLQYMYDMREQFMKAEGVAKVGAQVL